MREKTGVEEKVATFCNYCDPQQRCTLQLTQQAAKKWLMILFGKETLQYVGSTSTLFFEWIQKRKKYTQMKRKSKDIYSTYQRSFVVRYSFIIIVAAMLADQTSLHLQNYVPESTIVAGTGPQTLSSSIVSLYK